MALKKMIGYAINLYVLFKSGVFYKAKIYTVYQIRGKGQGRGMVVYNLTGMGIIAMRVICKINQLYHLLKYLVHFKYSMFPS